MFIFTKELPENECVTKFTPNQNPYELKQYCTKEWAKTPQQPCEKSAESSRLVIFVQLLMIHLYFSTLEVNLNNSELGKC